MNSGESVPESMPRVEGDDLEWEGQLKTWNDVPFTGIEVWRFANGAIESETAYKNGLSDGLARTWDERGMLRCEFTCRLGALYGKRRKWHANGQLAEDADFEWGVTRNCMEYDEQGGLLSQFTIDPHDPASQYGILLKFRAAYEPHVVD